MPHNLNKIFKSIADPTRREIFHLLVLASSALSITQISQHFEISRQGITKHIRMLRDAGLIDMTEKGREHFCLANVKPLKAIQDWVQLYERFWDNKLKSLGDHLDQKNK
ncbi:metalloregulator ArsR/SmtB family transcription factor [Fulvivirgaceae bacterium BMA12]|uniref:Metalloregulator ArsR/SmtB family transcription factor n=1 Tax=Agaribacillus aureus TaxID=3051825 RepID=A0ABT8KYU1_9BACT|nr:metalloregulator ArsR/SmtB family transcription factor [Fulvivirgaceae bacterium BMA12]